MQWKKHLEEVQHRGVIESLAAKVEEQEGIWQWELIFEFFFLFPQTFFPSSIFYAFPISSFKLSYILVQAHNNVIKRPV
jgi:hypothetical protein